MRLTQRRFPTGTDVEDLVRGFDAGSVDYITKPVKRPEVLARVATHLQIRVLQLLETILEWPRMQAGQKLDLLATRISDDELATLVYSLNDLRLLSLADPRVTDAGLRHLHGISSLRELILWNTRVTEQGVAELRSHLPECDVSTTAF